VERAPHVRALPGSRTPAILARALLLPAALLVHGALPGPARAGDEPPRSELDGDWGVRIVEPATGCEWLGQIRLEETAAKISGRGTAAPGPAARAGARCPRLAGRVEGERRGDVVRFGFATGPLGNADFEGRLAPQGGEMRGSWRTRAAAGQWAAGR